ncbi:MAG: Magnesium and cobalt efflux protein CorC [Chloroflexi bacterium ADurb.Bin325]|nr:MAG: Magnesium and cobalt efflux protein CorC [Chloroflexi bacterium ADurb.Bin325]
MENVGVEMLIVLLLVALNGIFAMSEISVVSARKARLQQRAEAGDRRARTALELARDPDEFLSTVQIGITLIGTLAGAFGGARIADPLAKTLAARFPAVAAYSGTLAMALVVGVITYLSLVIGELVPKRLGLNNPEGVASIVARPMSGLSRLVAPLVWLLTVSSDLLIALLHVPSAAEPAVTEEEIKVMLEQGAELGVLSAAESEVAQRVFRLGERRAGTLMTPRPEIVWLDVEDPWDELCAQIVESGHARFPVSRGSLDNVIGVVEAKTLLNCRLTAGDVDITSALRAPQFVPETFPAVQLLELFHDSRLHLALVVDEFGSIQGLVTVHDLLETVVGDITATGNRAEGALAVQRPDGSWLLDGTLPAGDFAELFRLSDLPGAQEGTYETLGGFVMMHLGRIPQLSDKFQWQGYRFEVVSMDGHRVDKVLVTPPSAEAETGD